MKKSNSALATKIIQQAMNENSKGVSKVFREAVKAAINKSIETKRAEIGANLLLITPEETE